MGLCQGAEKYPVKWDLQAWFDSLDLDFLVTSPRPRDRPPLSAANPIPVPHRRRLQFWAHTAQSCRWGWSADSPIAAGKAPPPSLDFGQCRFAPPNQY